MVLTPQNERFVLHFGEMGSRWGVNATVGQIYGPLFIWVVLDGYLTRDVQ